MSNHRNALPQLDERIFLTDGGMETTLIFDDGFDLPYFAAFDLLKEPAGVARIRRYYETYARIAVRAGSGFIFETPTWRASIDWGEKLGYDRQQIADVNLRSVAMLQDLREQFARPECPMVISGSIGPRGDGYRAEGDLSAQEAADYHREQIATFADSGADMVSAMTLTTSEEAIGVTLGARELGVPVAISFTTETDGRLPSGQPLEDAIQQVDAETDEGPAYFMLNCAHPSHFEAVLREGGKWRDRIRGLRANASKRSHAELDESADLDAGNPQELGKDYQRLRKLLPNLTILGGCCGTDHRHIEQISQHCLDTRGL